MVAIHSKSCRDVLGLYMQAIVIQIISLRASSNASASLTTCRTSHEGMEEFLHGATTARVSETALQRSQASLAALSRELGISPVIVVKWRKYLAVKDAKTGPKEPCSTILIKANGVHPALHDR